jgi:hypothetical protein
MEDFLWKRCKKAEKWVLTLLFEGVQQLPLLQAFAKSLVVETSSPLLAWTDSIILPEEEKYRKALKKIGYREEKKGISFFRHPGAHLPPIFLAKERGIAIKVESAADFLLANGYSSKIEGSENSPLRKVLIESRHKNKWWVVERRGSLGFSPINESPSKAMLVLEAKEQWKIRPRHSADPLTDFAAAFGWVDKYGSKIGKDRAAWIVLEVEREYWQIKNRAGQIQKCRQDRLGLGWGNHDHHTFRSSRVYFHHLVQFFERLGFYCRERFYAGKEAGWGAQVMENQSAGLVLFLDVDLTPEEVAVDFAHDVLEKTISLGTVGLWCALHGDSFLSAGMHHLEAQFSFETLTENLQKLGVKMMPPFSHFPYLKQAFTQGEMWPVKEERVRLLLKNKQITKSQAEKFLTEGALGSHLENLERKEGYKGFNQKNVSSIIKKTDPRLVSTSSSPIFF